MKIGVLALQGAFAEHISVLHRLEVETLPVRLPHQLVGLDGLIIPGGESTTITSLMLSYNLRADISRMVENGLPVLGTCAGMILLARKVSNDGIEPVAVMGITVRRNAFGRQRESFETDLAIPVLGEKPFPGVFIRAPLIEQVTDKVEVLARLDNGTIVAARQGKLLACAFHPELTDDLRFHQYFLSIVSGEQ
ncbi:MAG TPA: pyridoxal 5'-phosphate synthase glutaminase subunit PdxT [Dehalococcoidia bacterium]|nr:pyridoxal 5'-phosphate synthase glutaminase subunit PdxT [Dehalococcoidia bacterium]